MFDENPDEVVIFSWVTWLQVGQNPNNPNNPNNKHFPFIPFRWISSITCDSLSLCVCIYVCVHL